MQLFALMHNTALSVNYTLGELPELQFNLMKAIVYFSFAKLL